MSIARWQPTILISCICIRYLNIFHSYGFLTPKIVQQIANVDCHFEFPNLLGTSSRIIELQGEDVNPPIILLLVYIVATMTNHKGHLRAFDWQHGII